VLGLAGGVIRRAASWFIAWCCYSFQRTVAGPEGVRPVLGPNNPLRTYLADPVYDEANVRMRVKYLGNHETSSTVVCCRLLDPKWKLEIEAMAAG
jgi:hypothetical protein